MKFQIQRKPNPNVQHYEDKDLKIAYEFSKKAFKEFGNFLKAVVLFGAVARKKTKRADIDIMIIVDDLHIVIGPEMVDAYRVIVEKMVNETSSKLHITTLKLTNFWEYVRAGDPVIINVLRDGLPLIDSAFFEPLQMLLLQGRIRPSPEAIWGYYTKAPLTLDNSQWHLLQATLDLYWAVVDSAHAAIMAEGAVPASPEHIGDTIKEVLVKKANLDPKYARIADKFYDLSKKIIHRETKQISGDRYDELYKEAKLFVAAMKKIIESKSKK